MTPAKTSMTKWLAVATTAMSIATGPATADARSRLCRVAWKTTIPTSTFQPAWKLGIAAYWLTNSGGTIWRYPSACAVTVSTSGRSVSRGGATGKRAKMNRPASPLSRKALRSR